MMRMLQRPEIILNLFPRVEGVSINRRAFSRSFHEVQHEAQWTNGLVSKIWKLLLSFMNQIEQKLLRSLCTVRSFSQLLQLQFFQFAQVAPQFWSKICHATFQSFQNIQLPILSSLFYDHTASNGDWIVTICLLYRDGYSMFIWVYQS